jgi:hypothetical protein
MRSLTVLFAALLLGLGASACGNAGRSTTVATTAAATTTTSHTPTTAPAGGYLHNDNDADADDEPGGPGPESDDRLPLAEYGPPVGSRGLQAIASAVKSYYAAAAAGNGARGCALLAASLAAGLVEDQGQSSRSQTCAASLSLLFEHEHAQLANDEVATMTVIGAHARGNVGVVLLGFRKAPESELLIERENGQWKVDALSDSSTP